MDAVDRDLSVAPNYNLDDWVDAGCWDINIHTDHAYLYVTAYEMTTDPKGWSDRVAWQVVKPLPSVPESTSWFDMTIQFPNSKGEQK
jgi:hypothetical protein